jgi:molybdenum cofactor guanylyltransferase
MLFHMAQFEPTRIGFVLAGGKSSRMGVDKAFLPVGGRTLLDQALVVLASVCDRLTIVGDPMKFAQYESAEYGGRKVGPVVGDIFPECGPLAGIHTALVHSSAELNLMLAVDMPFISAALLSFLFAMAEQTEAIVTVPRVGKGLQPLCAVYRTDFRGAAEQALRAGNYKIEAAFSTVSIRVIADSELTAAGFSEQNFFNLNTPQDRIAAEGRRP